MNNEDVKIILTEIESRGAITDDGIHARFHIKSSREKELFKTFLAKRRSYFRIGEYYWRAFLVSGETQLVRTREPACNYDGVAFHFVNLMDFSN